VNSSIRLEGRVLDSEKRLYFDSNSLFEELFFENEMHMFYLPNRTGFMKSRMLPKLTKITSSEDHKIPPKYLLQGDTKEFLTFFGNSFSEYRKVIETETDDLDQDLASQILKFFENTSKSGDLKTIHYKKISSRRYYSKGILVHSPDITQDQLNKIFPKYTRSDKPFHDNDFSIPRSSKSSKILKIRSNAYFEYEINVLRKRLSTAKRFQNLLLIPE
jgi:hypothetical protein